MRNNAIILTQTQGPSGEATSTISKRIRRAHTDKNGYDTCGTLSDPAVKALYVTNPSDDKKRIEHTKGGLLKDSYKWILENSDFKKWRDDDEYRILWISGDPGKGKTMLLCGIIDELDKLAPSDVDLSYFFFQGADGRINSATAALRGLIYSLILQNSELIPEIEKSYNEGGGAPDTFQNTNCNAWFRLSGLFTRILDYLVRETSKTIYMVIDGLDECIDGLEKFLDLVS
ncbi:hypothetical protein TWF481_003712 [Arthrobotrys musiformis]|uniref:NACHT domain-containing protein n=1 Tax=Arthrobotrys musiformis TaxID=47236 RepID=A0AAV9WJD4_9PEZI